MTNIPGLRAAEIAWENKNPFDGEDDCDDAECGECLACLADEAEAQAEAYAEGYWEDMRLERKQR